MSPVAETGIAFFARNIEHLLFQRNFSHCKACFLRQDSQEKILWILVHSLVKFQIPFFSFFFLNYHPVWQCNGKYTDMGNTVVNICT